MIVYLRRKPLLLFSVVHINIPLRLPLRNVIRKSSIHRRSIVASVPLPPAKATEGAGAWLLLRPQRCTVAAVVPLLPVKARKGAGAWLLLRPQRCTVAAVVPLLPAKAGEGVGGWLLLRRQCCTVAAAVVSHKRFRTITMTSASALLYKCHLQKISFFFVEVQISVQFSTNLVQCVFAREGSVRLPQHLQYINRSSSPICSLSVLRSPCSPLLTPQFAFSAVPEGLASLPAPTISCFRGPGE